MVLAEEVVAQKLVDHLVLLEVVVSWHELLFSADLVLVVAVPVVVHVVLVPEAMLVVPVPEVAPVVPVLVATAHQLVEAIGGVCRPPCVEVLAQVLPPAFAVRPNGDQSPMELLSMPTIVASDSAAMVVAFGCSST